VDVRKPRPYSRMARAAFPPIDHRMKARRRRISQTPARAARRNARSAK